MHLDEAIRQIADIRQQMARSEVFRGFRALTVGLSGVAGACAAAVQARWIDAPGLELNRYLALWGGVALACLAMGGAEVYLRARRSGSAFAWQHTMLVAEQFLPSAVVGALLTLCIWRAAPEAAWMLPGLWALVFALGVFASCRLFPRAVFLVGCWYVLCGCACLLLGRGEHSLSPWLMGITFGGGQLLGAAVLYWTLERSHGASTIG